MTAYVPIIIVILIMMSDIWCFSSNFNEINKKNGTTMTDTLFVSNVNYKTLLGSTITASTMTISSITVSTMTASTIFSATGQTALGNNVSYPNRFVEVGSDVANSIYLDFHSSDAALPDYSTRIQSLGGATSGTGNLNMYASTIGLMPTVGVGIGVTVPSASLHIKNTASAMRITGNLTNTSTRPALSTTPGAFEIRGSGLYDGSDDGFLRLSAGGGSSTNVQSYIDLSGYSTVADMSANIIFGTLGLERMRIISNGYVGIGLTVPSAAMLHIGSSGIVRLGPSGNIGTTSAALGAEVSRYQIGFSAFRDIGFDQIGSKIVSINYNGWQNANPLTNYTELAFFTTSQTSGGSNYVDTTSERVRITGSGNVGIGTASPNSALTVAGNIAPSVTITNTLGTSSYVWGGTYTSWVSNMADTLTLYTAPTNGTISSYFNLVHNGSNYANLTQGKGPSIQFFAQGDILGGIYCLSNNTTTPNSAYYAITIRNSSGVNNNILYIVPTNATMANMYPGADAGGNLGIAGSRWSAVWAVNGAIQTSDTKEKDAVPLTYGLNEILQMRTIKYKWKSQADLPDDAPEKNYQYYGFCADELAPIFPELVYNEDPKVPVQMNYSELMPVMVNAIKEQNATIVSLQSQLAAQSSAIAALEARLAAAGL